VLRTVFRSFRRGLAGTRESISSDERPARGCEASASWSAIRTEVEQRGRREGSLRVARHTPGMPCRGPIGHTAADLPAIEPSAASDILECCSYLRQVMPSMAFPKATSLARCTSIG
jgi:hypothetical protein